MLIAVLSTTPFKAGWVFNLGQLLVLLGVGFSLLIAVSYWFLKPRFARLAATSGARPPAGAPALTLAPVSPPPATAASAAAVIEYLPAAIPAPVVMAEGEIAPDQETYDTVLAEQLAKGVNKKVAEGRARAAALVAARKKAEG